VEDIHLALEHMISQALREQGYAEAVAIDPALVKEMTRWDC